MKAEDDSFALPSGRVVALGITEKYFLQAVPMRGCRVREIRSGSRYDGTILEARIKETPSGVAVQIRGLWDDGSQEINQTFYLEGPDQFIVSIETGGFWGYTHRSEWHFVPARQFSEKSLLVAEEKKPWLSSRIREFADWLAYQGW